jgi:hypothetical protein
MDGAVTETWHGSNRPASIAYLLFDGSILRPCQTQDGYFNVGGSGGRIQRIDADDSIVWDYSFRGATRSCSARARYLRSTIVRLSTEPPASTRHR